jgi:mannose-6-phosphate isomerase-like protein (cupin superfamily)
VTGELIADRPDRRVEILHEADGVHATRTRLAAGSHGTDPHVHRTHSDAFYVLEGELTVRLGADGGSVAAGPGTLVVVPPLVVHAYRNAGDADVRFLNFHAPGNGFATYLRALRDRAPHDFDQHPPPDDGGRPAGSAIVAREAVRVDTDAIHIAEATAHAAAGDWVYVLDGELPLDDGDTLVAGAWAVLDHDAADAASARFLRVRPGVR